MLAETQTRNASLARPQPHPDAVAARRMNHGRGTRGLHITG
jgi:hypothetical protein